MPNVRFLLVGGYILHILTDIYLLNRYMNKIRDHYSIKNMEPCEFFHGRYRIEFLDVSVGLHILYYLQYCIFLSLISYLALYFASYLSWSYLLIIVVIFWVGKAFFYGYPLFVAC